MCDDEKYILVCFTKKCDEFVIVVGIIITMYLFSFSNCFNFLNEKQYMIDFILY
jgi:hypothetical protein